MKNNPTQTTASIQNKVTISSLEIAELTEKQHKNVLRDIKAMLGELKTEPSSFLSYYTNSQGKKQPCYHLPKEETLCLVAGYSAPLRMKIIQRLSELENKLLELSPYSLVNKHSTGFNNINQEAELVRTAKANILFLISRLEELNIADVIVNKGYFTYNYRLNQKEYVKKQTLKDYLQTQFNTLSQAFNSMYQPYYKEVIKLEVNKKHKELQKYLTNKSGCSCN